MNTIHIGTVTDDPPYPDYTAGGNADWQLIPYHMRGGVRRYIEYGIKPGHFLTAVLCNDLREAVARADEHNAKVLHQYIIFFYNYAPTGSWGSPRNFEDWLESGGLEGQAKRAEDSVAHKEQ